MTVFESTDTGAALGFPVAEYEMRLERARELMARAGIDCLLLTGPKNVRYLAGSYSSLFDASPSRPEFLIVPLEREPVALWPRAFAPGKLARTSWIKDVRTWISPAPEDEGVSLVASALREATKTGARIGAEIGQETRLGMPIADFLRLKNDLPDLRFVDATPVLRPLRARKSNAEIIRIGRAAAVLSDAFEAVPDLLRPGASELEIARALLAKIAAAGSASVPYLMVVSQAHGYDQCTVGPGDRRVKKGDVVYIDVGLTIDGYFCDFNRNWAVGRTDDDYRAAYRRVYAATEAGIAAARPGATASEVWRAMADVIEPGGAPQMPGGRMGHGIGFDITEAPSLAPNDHMVLEANMTLAIEPGLVLPAGGAMPLRRMLHEENVVVAEGGGRLLSRRAPAEMPVV